MQPFEPLARASEARQRQLRQLDGFRQELDPLVRKALAGLARTRWPQPRWLGLVPLPGARLRREIGPRQVTWWVENDIPPYDRYRCAAYLVVLALDEAGQPALTVLSGTRAEPLPWPLPPGREQALAQALAHLAQDPPAIIPRRMGAVIG